jgi:hypothetical protein
MLISGFRHDVDEICALLGYYAAYSGNSLPTFRDNLPVLSSRTLNVGLIRYYHNTLRNISQERRCRCKMEHFTIFPIHTRRQVTFQRR